VARAVLGLVIFVFGPLLDQAPLHLLQFVIGMLILLLGMAGFAGQFCERQALFPSRTRQPFLPAILFNWLMPAGSSAPADGAMRSSKGVVAGMNGGSLMSWMRQNASHSLRRRALRRRAALRSRVSRVGPLRRKCYKPYAGPLEILRRSRACQHLDVPIGDRAGA